MQNHLNYEKLYNVRNWFYVYLLIQWYIEDKELLNNYQKSAKIFILMNLEDTRRAILILSS